MLGMISQEISAANNNQQQSNLCICLVPALCEELACGIENIVRECAVVVIYRRAVTVSLQRIDRFKLVFGYGVGNRSVV